MQVIGAVLENEQIEGNTLICTIVLTFSNHKNARIFCSADREKGESLKAIDITPMEGACPRCQRVTFSSFTCGCNIPAKKEEFLQKAISFLKRDVLKLIVKEGFTF